MADNVAITAGSGTTIATDDVSGVQHQRVKLVTSADGSADPYGDDTPATTTRALWTAPRTKIVRIAVTPTISTTPAYTAKDAMGGLMTFSTVNRATGNPVFLDSVQVLDKGQVRPDLDLVLFDRTFTAPTDNSIFNPSDAEAATIVAVIPIGGWSDFSGNSIADVPVGRQILPNGTDLFGALVCRTTPTMGGTTDIVVTLNLVQG